MIVGLTGGIGSGKTTVLNLFKEFKNIVVYNADLEAKQLMNSSTEIRNKLIKEYGNQSFKNDNLNREYISKIVFKDKKKLEKLNAIVHPAVKKHFQDFVKLHENKAYILYENAILFETKNNNFCDVIITVFTPLELRIERLIKRDKTTKEAVLDRMRNQFSEDKKLLQSHYVVFNTSKININSQIQRIHNFLTKKR